MLSGVKTATSRTKKYGKIGDTFTIFGETFTITNIFKEKLEKIAERYFLQEGFLEPEEFIEIWKKLHPRKGWDPEQEVWVHFFQKGLIKIGQKKLEV